MNRVFGGNPLTGQTFVRSNASPAKIHVWNNLPILIATVSGFSLGAYGKFVKGYNSLWLLAGVLPVSCYMIVASGRQPTTTTENAYRYLLAKRAATCELEANAEKISKKPFAQKDQFADLQNLMRANSQTLYDVEADLVDRLMKNGKL